MAKVAVRKHQWQPGDPVRLNPDSPQATGLVAWWPTADYSSGNLADKVGSNHGVLNGSVATVEHATANRMLRFVGTAGNYFSVPSAAALNITGNLSISFWMVPRWPSESTYYGILGKGTQWPEDLCQYMFYKVDSTGTIDWQVGNGTTTFIVAEAKPLNVNTLYHVVGVHDGSHMITYLNSTDTESWTGTANNLLTSTDPLTIGYVNVAGGSYAYCDLSDIRLYNRALSASDVAAIHADPWDLYQ